MNQEQLLKGRVAIVTGSGQGVGKAIALALADLGCKIVTNNRRPGSSLYALEDTRPNLSEKEIENIKAMCGDAETVAAEIRQRGGEAIACFGDLCKSEDCKRIVDTAINTWGRIDILVNNGASFFNSSVLNFPIEKFEQVVSSKLLASFYMMHYALPYMKEQGYGRVLNASSNAFIGLMGMSAYSAAACGIWAYTKACAQDLAGTGITVNAYTPLARTRSWENTMATFREQGIPEEAIYSFAPPSMRTGPDGMAPFLAYLCTEEAEDITGLMFNVESAGGLSLWAESHEYNRVEKDIPAQGAWTLDELREARKTLLKETKTAQTTLELH